VKRSSRLAGVLSLLLMFNLTPPAVAADQQTIQQAATRTVQYIQGKYQVKGAAAIDDWTIIGLALQGESIGFGRWGTKREWQAELERRQRSLDPRKTTDFARFIMTILAAGEDPARFGGSSMTERLKKAQLANGKFADSMDGRGQELVNAHVWSIIALYAAGEPIPRAGLAKSWLLSKQLPDGGFQFYTGAKQSGVDMTAMSLLAMRALGMKKEELPVKRALAFLRNAQTAGGGYAEGGVSNSESAANVISSLIAWGEQPNAWKKGTSSVVDQLLAFQKADGSFAHTRTGAGNQIATSQALLALSDLKRGASYLSTLREKAGARKLSLLRDVNVNHWAYKEISFLVKNGYMQGVTSEEMKPSAPVTRAQFAALLLRAVGEVPNARVQGMFRDVPASDWSALTVEKAAALGLMQGSRGLFRPHQGITHEEMAVISSRVAQRYGWKKSFPASRVEVPWSMVSSWATSSVRDLQSRGLLGGTESRRFAPKAGVTRAEAAVLLYRLLATR
jgi:hypothetical protein